MNCNETQNRVEAFLDTELDVASAAAVEAHCARCDRCAARLEAERVLRLALRALPVEPMGFDLATRAIAAARRKHSNKRHFWLGAGVGSALAASVAMWLVAVPLMHGPQSTQLAQSPSAVINVAQLQSVRLAFNAPSDFMDVTLSIELPEHVELSGFPAQTRVSWQTDLSKGQNVLTLPVVLKQARSGYIVATLSTKTKNRVFKIKIDPRLEEFSHTNNNVQVV